MEMGDFLVLDISYLRHTFHCILDSLGMSYRFWITLKASVLADTMLLVPPHCRQGGKGAWFPTPPLTPVGGWGLIPMGRGETSGSLRGLN